MPELLFVILVVALIPAISEEFLFRGLVQRVLQRRLPPFASAVVAGIVFGAYHLNPFTFVPLVAIGIYLGFLAMRANSLWVSIAAHFYNNLFACVAVYFHLSDDNVVVGDAGVMSLPGLLLTFWFFGVVFLVSTYYFIVITRRRPAEEQPPQLPDNPQDSP